MQHSPSGNYTFGKMEGSKQKQTNQSCEDDEMKTYHGDEMVKYFINYKLPINKKSLNKTFSGAIKEMQKGALKHLGRKLTIAELTKYLALFSTANSNLSKKELNELGDLLYFVEVAEKESMK